MAQAEPWRRTRLINQPNPGFYTVRLCPGGWAVPALIAEQGGEYSAWLDGARMPRTWTVEQFRDLLVGRLIALRGYDHPLLKIHYFGWYCDEKTYLHRLAMKEWARANLPAHPCLHPHQPIDQRHLPADMDF